MSTRARVAYLAVAALIAVVAFVVLGGGDDPEQRAGAGAEPTATAEPAPPPAGEEDNPEEGTPPRPPLLQPGTERRLTVKQGDRVRLRVRSDAADHVHVHGYDIMREVPAGRTIRLTFEATIPGIFEVELEDSHELLARLRVEQ